MLLEAYFRLFAYLSHSSIHRTSIINNPKNIKMGRSCRLEPFCIIKGGANSDSGLFIGDNVIIKNGAYVSACNSIISISNFAFIGAYSWTGGKGNIKIGTNTMISINCVLISSNHDYQNIPVPYYSGEEIIGDITIGNNVWIGSSSVILPGVKIGDGSVIGAGSIITKDIPQDSMAFGNPAKIIKSIIRR